MLDQWRTQRATAKQLMQHWDDVVGGAPGGQDTALADAAMQHAVRQIQTMDDAPAIDPTFSAQLLQELTSQSRAQWSQHTEPLVAASPVRTAMNGSVSVMPPRPLPPAPRIPQWPKLWGLATTALLLLAIAAGIFIWNTNREPVPAVIPLLTETTETGITIETVLEEQIPAGRLPENTENLINVWKYVLEPGETFADEPSLCEPVPSLTIGYIESGTLSLTTTGPFEVTRAGGATESIPAGREAVLTAGDKYVYYSDTTEHFTGERNAGGEPLVQIVTTWALDKGCASSPPPLIPTWVWGDSKYAYDFDQARPVSISLQRATIPPGPTLSSDDATRIGFTGGEDEIFRLVTVESGTLEETWVPEALMQAEIPGTESEVQSTFGPGQSWMSGKTLAPPDGQERSFRAGGEEPIELVILSAVYDDAADLDDGGADAADIAGLDRQLLLDHSFAANAVPRDNDITLVLNRADVPPGEAVAFPSSCGVPLLMAAAVESGEYAVRPASEMEITRADRSLEVLAAGNEAVLAAGDSFILPNVTGDELSNFRNGSQEPLVILQAVWFPERSCEYESIDSEAKSQITWMESSRLPASEILLPFRLQIQRVNPAAHVSFSIEDVTGTELPLFHIHNHRYIVVESGTVYVNRMREFGSEEITVFANFYKQGEIVSLNELSNPPAMYYHELIAYRQNAELTLVTLVYEQPDSG